MGSVDMWSGPPAPDARIFPALQALLKRGRLNVPVNGGAKAGWNLDQLRERARGRAR